MAMIGDWAKAFDFGCDYLKERGGSETEFVTNIQVREQRIGQAFFNALSGTDQEKLHGKIADPFYANNPDAIWHCIEYLMDR